MPEFTYEALQSTGARSQGVMVAGSEREVMAMLDARGLYPVQIALKGQAHVQKGGRRVGSRHLATFYSQLADLLHSGVPLLRSLELLERQASQAALAEVLREVKARVADGTALAEAMAAHPRTFSELAVSMVRAGQEGGFLEDVLRRIADFTEHQEDLKAKVTGALAYPVFLAVIGVLVLNVLVIFFVPRFKPIFDKLAEKGQLPPLTVFIIGLSNFMQNSAWLFMVAAAVLFIALVVQARTSNDKATAAYLVVGGAVFLVRAGRVFAADALGFFEVDPFGAVLLGAFVGGVIWFAGWKKTDAGRRFIDAMWLKVPGLGTVLRNLALSRFTRILGTMLGNGIPILLALRIAKDSAGNKVLSEAIEKSAENVKSGDSLAKPLGACPQFPRDVVEMVSVGEESNNLEKVLIDISESLEKRTARQLELFVRLLEPAMLLVMAVFTLIIVAGLLLPVFKMSSAIG